MDMETMNRLAEPVTAVNAQDVFGKAFPKRVTLIEVASGRVSVRGKNRPDRTEA